MQRALAESRAASATARSAELLQQLALLGATEPADVLLLAEHELVAAGATVAGARRLRAAVAAACDDDTLANVTPQHAGSNPKSSTGAGSLRTAGAVDS